jgi:prolycopene isomerase
LGKSVLAVEQGDGPGGYAKAFRRESYVFDPAIHVTAPGFGELDLWDLFLGGLDVADRVELVEPEPFYAVRFPDLSFDAPAGIEPFIEAHVSRFPEEADGIRSFIDACMQITFETQQLSTRLTLKGLEDAVKEFPFMFRYRMTTLREALDEHIGDSRVKAVLAAAWPYVGVPPGRLSFVQFAAMLASLVEKGPRYVEGGFGKLADALATAIEKNGGQLVLNTRVERISLQDGRATGVRLEDGTNIGASTVISNADARQTLEHMVGFEHLPDRFVRRLGRMKPSVSAFAIYAAASLDLSESGLAHETFLYTDWDHDRAFESVLAGRLGGSWLSLPTLRDPGLAPAGEHLVTLTTLMAYDAGAPWSELKDSYAEQMADHVERFMPGFRDATTFLESATPETFARYTLSSEGAIYGWANTPDQSQPKRLPQRTPIDELFLVGHWTEPGSGTLRVIFSGLQVAQSVLSYETPAELLRALGEAPASAGADGG